jgi:hypothetical protein
MTFGFSEIENAIFIKHLEIKHIALEVEKLFIRMYFSTTEKSVIFVIKKTLRCRCPFRKMVYNGRRIKNTAPIPYRAD